MPHPSAQKGIATILIVLVVGLVMSVAVLNVASYVRQSQTQNVTMLSQTQSQISSWTGAEIVRQYLAKLTSTQIQALVDAHNANTPISLTLETTQLAGLSADLIQVGMSGTSVDTMTFRIHNIQHPDTRAQASSTLDVVYSMGTPIATPASPPMVLSYNKNLALGGQITVLKDATDTSQYQINVEGDIAAGHNTITGVDIIVSTGSVNISSGSSFKEVRANCDVNLSGSVTVANIYAVRNVCTTGSAGSGTNGLIVANGSVDVKATNGTIYAHANTATVAGCAASGSSPSAGQAQVCPIPFVTGVNLSGGNNITKLVKTTGNVQFNGGTVQRIDTEKTLTVPSSGTVVAGTASAVTKPSWNSSINVNVITSNKIGTIPSATTLSIQSETFNAYSKNPNDPDDAALTAAQDVRANANYLFTVDTNGYKKVTVQNVNGISNGTYFIGNYSGGNYDYLCTAVSGTAASPTCTTPASATSTKKIGKGYSNWNSLISYNSSNQTWRLDGVSLAPGIAWFEGSLEVGSGTYYNTFIATHNISTSGATVVYAPNYAGYDGSAAGAPTGICTNSNFPGLAPKQFCQDGAFVVSPFGDYAAMAGSWPKSGTVPKLSSNYQGGNIKLGASSKIYGSVKAGNELYSGGSTVIHGYASALAMGQTVSSSLGGSTTFDLRNLPPTFKPQGMTPPSQTSSGSTTDVHIKWARYR